MTPRRACSNCGTERPLVRRNFRVGCAGAEGFTDGFSDRCRACLPPAHSPSTKRHMLSVIEPEGLAYGADMCGHPAAARLSDPGTYPAHGYCGACMRSVTKAAPGTPWQYYRKALPYGVSPLPDSITDFKKAATQ